MILSTHILSGAALGANIQNPYVVAVLSIVLHFILDFLPHGDYLNKKSRLWECWKGILDVAIGLIIVSVIIFLFGNGLKTSRLTGIAIGIFFSLLPDATTFFYLFLKIRFLKPVYGLHQFLHKVHYPDFAPEREFHPKNNLWDIFVSLASIIIIITST